MELYREHIIEALKHCKSHSCGRCPLNEFCEEEGVIEGSSKLCGDALALINTLTDEVKLLRIIKDLLNQDIADRDALLEKKVEEVYPEFMQDYKAMREELNGVYEELEETKRNLRKAQKGNY